MSCYSCGIICGYKEILGAMENVSEATCFLLDFIEQSYHKPSILIYDNACKVSKYSENHSAKNTERSIHLDKMEHVIDKFHFKNHTEPDCKKYCNPHSLSVLNNLNTSVCEQTNFWFGRYKHMLKSMKLVRFHFFIFTILNEYNTAKFNGLQPNIVFKKRKEEETVNAMSVNDEENTTNKMKKTK